MGHQPTPYSVIVEPVRGPLVRKLVPTFDIGLAATPLLRTTAVL